jgi:hypothetical protein
VKTKAKTQPTTKGQQQVARLCPFRNGRPCLGWHCTLWVRGLYTSEFKQAEGMCSFEAIARKNSDGTIPV